MEAKKFLNVFRANEYIVDMSAALKTATDELATVKAELAKATDLSKDFTTAKSAYEAQFNTEKEALVKGHEAAIADYQAKLDEANKATTAVVANLAIEADAVTPTTEAVELNPLAALNKLSGKEKQEFYHANREAILKATGYQK